MKTPAFLLLLVACTGSASTESASTESSEAAGGEAASESENAGAETPCLQTAEALAIAFAELGASYDGAKPDLAEPVVWSDAFRRWNGLQAEGHRVAEGSDAPGAMQRYRIWATEFARRGEALRAGPWSVNGEFLQVGTEVDEGLVVKIAIEDGCFRLDDN
ncbi:MAG: hypothetical protein AAGE52_25460 [Myxococcota bacterium]